MLIKLNTSEDPLAMNLDPESKAIYRGAKYRRDKRQLSPYPFHQMQSEHSKNPASDAASD
jgi:hypothetical protein